MISGFQIISAHADEEGVPVRECRQITRKIVRQTGVPPSSLVLQSVKKTSKDAISGGGFSDVYKGEYEGKIVALKVPRMFTTEENRLNVQSVRKVECFNKNSLIDDGSLIRKLFTRRYSGEISNIQTSFCFLE